MVSLRCVCTSKRRKSQPLSVVPRTEALPYGECAMPSLDLALLITFTSSNLMATMVALASRQVKVNATFVSPNASFPREGS